MSGVVWCGAVYWNVVFGGSEQGLPGVVFVVCACRVNGGECAGDGCVPVCGRRVWWVSWGDGQSDFVHGEVLGMAWKLNWGGGEKWSVGWGTYFDLFGRLGVDDMQSVGEDRSCWLGLVGSSSDVFGVDCCRCGGVQLLVFVASAGYVGCAWIDAVPGNVGVVGGVDQSAGGVLVVA